MFFVSSFSCLHDIVVVGTLTSTTITISSPSQRTTPLALPATYLWPPYLLRRPCCGVRRRLLAGARYLGGEGVGSVRAPQLKKLSPSLASLRQWASGGDIIPFIY